ncbi:integrase arm-type DNA-binding domain-containing protein [Alicycliphilus denitrificans]|uniref:integrase arm-type DNA-binding domain-containing protein n=1 Tax=Alicycliphilus denitrificans TaxID=179636 RepID=UPI0009DA9B3E
MRLTASAQTKTWIYRYRSPIGQKVRQVRQGRWSAVSEREACNQWQQLIDDCQKGGDPALARKLKRVGSAAAPSADPLYSGIQPLRAGFPALWPFAGALMPVASNALAPPTGWTARRAHALLGSGVLVALLGVLHPWGALIRGVLGRARLPAMALLNGRGKALQSGPDLFLQRNFLGQRTELHKTLLVELFGLRTRQQPGHLLPRPCASRFSRALGACRASEIARWSFSRPAPACPS